MLSTVSSFKREHDGISLETLQWQRASSRVEGRIPWFSPRLGGKFEVPLELRRGPQGPACVASGKSCLLSNCEGHLRIPPRQCRGIGPHLELRPEPQGSSPILTWISGFLWSFNRESGLVLCLDMELCFPLVV